MWKSTAPSLYLRSLPIYQMPLSHTKNFRKSAHVQTVGWLKLKSVLQLGLIFLCFLVNKNFRSEDLNHQGGWNLEFSFWRRRNSNLCLFIWEKDFQKNSCFEPTNSKKESQTSYFRQNLGPPAKGLTFSKLHFKNPPNLKGSVYKGRFQRCAKPSLVPGRPRCFYQIPGTCR